ncbi:hypothetical protein pb186bvf_000910 [Paramecium bursaria]
MFKKAFFGFTGLTGLYGIYDYNSENQLLTRNIRTIMCGINILYQYKIRFNAETADEVHENVAKSIYETCLKNDGLYVKFGQGIAAMEHLLPPPYYKWMSLLQDKAKQVPFYRIQEIIENDLGKPINEIFEWVDKQAIASASLAQVHKGRLKYTNIDVAIKVQKPNIKPQFKLDMFMHYVVCLVLEWSFDMPLLQFQQTIDENLAREIDFTIERDNAQQAKGLLEKFNRKDVYIPIVYDQYLSQRVYISEWIDGVKITNTDEIKKMGFNPKEVLKTVIGSFAEQIFITGFIHCDPHPGNVFVRRRPENPKQYQVVILDWGLCIEIPNEFRLDYANFWKYLFLQDRASIKTLIKKWGIDNDQMFASMQLMKPYQYKKPVHSHQLTSDEVLQLQLKMKDEIREMMKQTDLFPKELLFVNRNMNLVRSVNKRCGSLVNRINLMARYAEQGSQIKEGILEQKKFKKIYSSSFFFEFRLLLSSLVYTVMNWWMKIKGTNFEDFIEQKQKQQMQEIHLMLEFFFFILLFYPIRIPKKK